MADAILDASAVAQAAGKKLKLLSELAAEKRNFLGFHVSLTPDEIDTMDRVASLLVLASASVVAGLGTIRMTHEDFSDISETFGGEEAED